MKHASIRSGGADYESDSGPAPVGADWLFQRLLTFEDPDTAAAWAPADVDAAEFGVKLSV